MDNILKKITQLKNGNEKVGIYSACSANPFVIKAVLKRGKTDGSCVLIESTANQCNQFGGYTGMKPEDFKTMVLNLADECEFDRNQVLLGGDHLGPLTFTKYDEEDAMRFAEDLVEEYVLAGYTKIHLDTSMMLASDNAKERLSDDVIVNRTVQLAKKAESAFETLRMNNPKAVHPVYVIGSEVPVPGGSVNTVKELEVTKSEDFLGMVHKFKDAFLDSGLEESWENVIGFVVQPGVEENDFGCVDYDRSKAIKLSEAISECPNLVFEAHSTDYQTRDNLRKLVEDGFAILKVGPALTYALREGLFALSFIEDQLCDKPSEFREILEKEMQLNTEYWSKYYCGDDREQKLKRRYSFSDRSRYYMNLPDVKTAVDIMLHNLDRDIPLGILRQYMPKQYDKIRNGELNNVPEELLIDKVYEVIDDYLYATHQRQLMN